MTTLLLILLYLLGAYLTWHLTVAGEPRLSVPDAMLTLVCCIGWPLLALWALAETLIALVKARSS